MAEFVWLVKYILAQNRDLGHPAPGAGDGVGMIGALPTSSGSCFPRSQNRDLGHPAPGFCGESAS
jgi:hypothetical protein